MTDSTSAQTADRLAIAEVIADYGEAIDRRNNGLLASLFVPGAMLHYGVFDGTIEQLVAFLEQPSEMEAAQHHFGNIRIRFDGPDAARSIAYGNIVVRARRDGVMVDEMVRNRYLDRWVRRNGAWLLAERTMIYDWIRVEPASDHEQWARPSVLTGSRGPADPAAGFLDG